LNYQDADSLVIHAWPDADLAGDEMTTKSTSGFFLELAGPGGRGIPVSWGSKRQGCTATHTAEAEIVSLASCLKSEVIPTQMLIERILGRPVPAIIFEDNAAAIVAASKGYSPSMRYLKRTQRTSIGLVYDITHPDMNNQRIKDGFESIVVSKCPTSEQKGDLFTKCLPRAGFEAALDKIRMTQHGH
jgi:hypothetical protein